MTPWRWWVSRVERPVDPRPLALVRILLPSVILLDQLHMGWLGLVQVAYRNGLRGGIAMNQNRWYVMDVLGSDSGTVVWMLLLLCMGAAAMGVGARGALLIGAVLSAQLSHGFHWDNGGDRISRWFMLLLAGSGAVHVWTVRGSRFSTIHAWPADIGRLLLCLVYTGAGLAKLFPRPGQWLSTEGGSQTLRILSYPMTSDLSASFWHDWVWTGWFLDVATIGVELSAFLILTRHRHWWALCAAPIHLGIAWGMTIDAFSLIMLSLYPLLLDAWVVRAADRLGWTLAPPGEAPGPEEAVASSAPPGERDAGGGGAQ